MFVPITTLKPHDAGTLVKSPLRAPLLHRGIWWHIEIMLFPTSMVFDIEKYLTKNFCAMCWIEIEGGESNHALALFFKGKENRVIWMYSGDTLLK